MVVSTWQAYMQQIVRYVGHGSFYFCRMVYPAKKQEKWPAIDEKLRAKYGADKSKYQRYRRRSSGAASYVHLRWQDQAVMLRSDGQPMEVDDPDTWCDIRKAPLQVRLSVDTTLIVRYTHKVQVYLDRDSYDAVKARITSAITERQPKLAVRYFNWLNGLPAFAGLVTQKKTLKAYAIGMLRKHKQPIMDKSLRINTRLKIVPIS